MADSLSPAIVLIVIVAWVFSILFPLIVLYVIIRAAVSAGFTQAMQKHEVKEVFQSVVEEASQNVLTHNERGLQVLLARGVRDGLHTSTSKAANHPVGGSN